MKNLAIITARSGSKGLKDKNVRELDGKPLIAYSIEVAINSKQFDEVVVSTDSEKYADISRKFGASVPFLRSPATSTDTADSWDVVREVVDNLMREDKIYDTIMLLQPTSPLRSVGDVINSFDLMKEKNANAILSVTEMEHSPIWSNVLPDDGCMDNFRNKKYAGLPRQQLPIYYRINGAIYLVKRKELYKTEMFCDRCYAYIMPKERSVDIDTLADFKLAEYILDSWL